jgi:hypothetical protein
MKHNDTTTRAGMLQKLAAAPIAIGALAALRAQAEAAATMDPKSPAVAYVAKSTKKGQECAGCNFFIPNKDAKKPGTCQLVKGPINPGGWCKLFSPKKK